MILTVTPNPTIDRATFVRGFRLGGVVRAEREVVTPSGKGIGASLVLRELGQSTVAIGLRAGLAGEMLVRLLDRWDIAHDLVPAEGETRTATVLIDREIGAQSTISACSLQGSGTHVECLLRAVDRHAASAWGAICAGSLPAGLPDDTYVRVLHHCRRLGLYTLLDTSGRALLPGVGARPEVLKLNAHEFAVLAPGCPGPDLGTPEGRSALVERLLGLTRELDLDAVVLTIGVNGAVLVVDGGAYWARPPRVPVLNTAGAGDALGAGLMWGRSEGARWPDALALGTAAAASVVAHQGTAVCERAQVIGLLSGVTVCRVNPGDGAISDRCGLTEARTLLDSAARTRRDGRRRGEAVQRPCDDQCRQAQEAEECRPDEK